MPLTNCWEIKNCGREHGGAKVEELKVCPAYPDHGHSCWAVTGTLCGGTVQGTFAQKEMNCLHCETYKLYNLRSGTKILELISKCAPEMFFYLKSSAEHSARQPPERFLYALTDAMEQTLEERAQAQTRELIEANKRLGEREKELRTQNMRFKTALDNMGEGLCMFDADKRLVVCNDRYANIYQLPPELLKIGTPHQAIIEHRVRNGILAGAKSDHAVDERLKALDELPASAISSRIDELADGRFICITRQPMDGGGWVATHEDITERRRMEGESRTQSLRFDTALNNMSQGLAMYDVTACLVLCNDRYLEMYGLSRERVRPGCRLPEILGLCKEAGNFAGDPDQFTAETLAMVAQKNADDRQLKFADGRTVRALRQPMADGGWVVTLEDVTERLRIERERDRHQAFLNTIVDNVPTAVFVKDARERRYVLINRKFEEIHGVVRSAVVGKSTHDLFSKKQADVMTESEEETLRAGTYSYERELPMPGNGTRLVAVKRIAIRGADGTPQYLLGVVDDITEQRQSERLIAHMARYDALTDLPNRAQFSEELDRAVARVQRGGQFALLYLDLDHFKRVNDTLGHPIGDQLLKTAADRLRGCVRETDLIARLGGDEFAIIQSPVDQPSDAATLAERIGKVMRAPFDLDGHQVTVDVSIGIAIAPNDAMERDELLKNTDIALYGAKDGGRGIYCFYERGMDMRMKAQQKLEQDLRHGFTNGEFELYYQPMVNLQSNQVSGCEALLRWHHPDRGMVLPAEFIPIAEESGFIIPLGEWVLRRACADAAAWPDEIRLAVNLSPAQMKGRKLVETVVGALAASGLPASRLELEVTETVLMQDTFAALATLHQLRNLGVRISMDDFGTGYSSLSYLRSFPFDNIKIDRSFIKDISDKDDCTAIVQAVIHMAQRLNMTTVAEGIETEEQRQKVQELGCTEMQGYLFSRPLPIEDIVRLFVAPADSVMRVA